MDWDRKWLDFNAGENKLNSFDQLNNCGVIEVKINGSNRNEKSSFKMLTLCEKYPNTEFFLVCILSYLNTFHAV